MGILIICVICWLVWKLFNWNDAKQSTSQASKLSQTEEKIVNSIEEIYSFAQKNHSIHPVAIYMFPRRIASNYLSCSIKLITNLSESDIWSAENAAEKERLYLQVAIEEYGVVVKYDSAVDIGGYQSFERSVWNAIKRRHPDWNFSSDGKSIRF
ncbi:MAG: hypothetical protein IKU84_04570 [Clostridia bacterium]|nr:hypothetical protein [Clostridia bacterium]